MQKEQKVREVFTGYFPIAYAHNSDVGVRQSNGEKIRMDDVEFGTVFDSANLVEKVLEYPNGYIALEDLLHRKTLPENGETMNTAQLLLGRHPLVERYDAVYTKDEVTELPEGVFMDGEKLVVLHSAVTAVDGKKQEIMLFAVDDPNHYETKYGFVEVTKNTTNSRYDASGTATICQIVNCY